MSVFTSHTFARVKANEFDLVAYDYHAPLAGKTAVLVALPHNYGPASFIGVDEITDLAEAGYFVVCPSGPISPLGQTFGNDQILSSLDAAWAYAQSVGCRGDRVFLLGMSMGGLAVCNWARTHLALVHGIAGVAPALDLAHIHGLASPYPAEVEAAYGGPAGYAAALPTYSPVNYANTLAPLPVRVWYSTDDPLIPLSSLQPFATAHEGTTLTSMGAIGHNPVGTVGSDIASWFGTLA